eukprot:g10902.t1
MMGSKGKSEGSYIMDDDQERENGSTGDPTNPDEGDDNKEEKSSRRGSSSSATNGWPTTTDAGRDGSLTAFGQHNTTTTAPQPKGEAALVPAVGGGSSTDEHNSSSSNRVEDQQTLRAQLESLVSHKLRTIGDLDNAGLAALEALNKLPAARDQTQQPVVDGAKKKILPLGLEKIKKFSGKDPHYLTDCLNQFYSLVVAALPASSPASVNRALNRDVVFVLEGSALKFFNALKAGHVQWEATPPVPDEDGGSSSSSSLQQQHQEDGQGRGKRFRPPSTWHELYEAFHDHYLPVTGIARTSARLFSSIQAPDESVLSLAQRQLGLATHLQRLIEANGKQIDFMEAISIRLFERALRADLRRIQDAEPPCSSFQESVDRAERNAIRLAKKTASTTAVVAQFDNGGGSESSCQVALPAARSNVASSEDSGGGGGGVFSGAIPKHANKSNSEESDGKERSSPTTPQGRDAVGKGRDVGHEAGVLPHDDEFRSYPRWQAEPGGGEGEAGQGFEKRHNIVQRVAKRTRDWPGPEMHRGGGEVDQPFPPTQRAQMVDPRAAPRVVKRTRDWPGPAMHHGGGGGANQPFLPPERARMVDPGATPPCTVKQCKTINRQFHCSNDCFFHPTYGEQNKKRMHHGRKKGFRRGQPDHRGPQQQHDGWFGGQ